MDFPLSLKMPQIFTCWQEGKASSSLTPPSPPWKAQPAKVTAGQLSALTGVFERSKARPPSCLFGLLLPFAGTPRQVPKRP